MNKSKETNMWSKLLVVAGVMWVTTLCSSAMAQSEVDKEGIIIHDELSVKDVVAGIKEQEEKGEITEEQAKLMLETLKEDKELLGAIEGEGDSGEGKGPAFDLATEEGKAKAIELIQQEAASGKSGLSEEQAKELTGIIEGANDPKELEAAMRDFFEKNVGLEGTGGGDGRGDYAGREGSLSMEEMMREMGIGRPEDSAKAEAFRAEFEKQFADAIREAYADKPETFFNDLGVERDYREYDGVAEFTPSAAEMERMVAEMAEHQGISKEDAEAVIHERMAAGREWEGRSPEERAASEKEMMERMGVDRETMERMMADREAFEKEMSERGDFDREAMEHEREAWERSGMERETLDREAFEKEMSERGDYDREALEREREANEQPLW